MTSRRIRQQSLATGNTEGSRTNSVDKLAFKYMMCKVESSTDSESDISPRWSDTSTMGCVSSTPESRCVQRRLPLSHKPAGRQAAHSLSLDPYDGSSEDSDESSSPAGVPSRRARQQGGGGGGGCRFFGRSKRVAAPHHHPSSSSSAAAVREAAKNEKTRDSGAAEQKHLTSDVPMRSGESDSELWVCELDVPSSLSDRSVCRDPIGEMSVDSALHTTTKSLDSQVHCGLDDSGVHIARTSAVPPRTPGSLATPMEGNSVQPPDGCTEGSPPGPGPPLRTLYKRKLGLAGAEEFVAFEQKKRQCVDKMEEERGDSP